MYIKGLQYEYREQALIQAGYHQESVGNKINAMIDRPKRGQFWQGDHIKEVVRGGGVCGLDNLQTLCTPCHDAKTKQLLSDLRKLRRRQKVIPKKKSAKKKKVSWNIFVHKCTEGFVTRKELRKHYANCEAKNLRKRKRRRRLSDEAPPLKRLKVTPLKSSQSEPQNKLTKQYNFEMSDEEDWIAKESEDEGVSCASHLSKRITKIPKNVKKQYSFLIHQMMKASMTSSSSKFQKMINNQSQKRFRIRKKKKYRLRGRSSETAKAHRG
eukprot:TRINITY_DN1401_c0_g1_i1.p1 TRINITY_DN1401_c0_g1~~TRINITY_DN1401_c0_g1_i1.p1  ORF type:complete len:280 (+),score=85.55 TRINITY_DN1401_c0_g1_i1:37-840(+)